jgi:hypothetical protein
MAWNWTEHYSDLSTDQGYQFKFNCERCGDAYTSTFERNAVGTVGSLLRGASSMFGGLYGASQAADSLRETLEGPAKDEAFKKAVAEVEPRFGKCQRCGNWVCRKSCFNTPKRMCKHCAPIGEEEATALKADHARTEVSNDLALEEERRVRQKAKEAAATCPDCGVETLGKKFCPGCGKKLAVTNQAFCGECGAKLTPGAKFCGECGAKG